MSNDQIEQIELNIEDAKQIVARKQSVENLLKNTHFKRVITEGYFKDEASRLVLLKADMNYQTPESQAQIDKSIIGIGYLRQYLSSLVQLGNMAENAIASDEATLEELLAEKLGE